MTTKPLDDNSSDAIPGADTQTVSDSYENLHKPSSEFESRDAYLEHELQIMQPKRWRPNLPFRDYRFEFEDTIPAMAATINPQHDSILPITDRCSTNSSSGCEKSPSRDDYSWYYLDPDSADMEGVKVPPHSQEAEQSVLGGLMVDNNAWDAVSEIVLEDQFYRHDHRLIFRTIEKLVNNMQPIDVVTISEELDRTGNLDAAGGLDYLVELARNTPSLCCLIRCGSI